MFQSYNFLLQSKSAAKPIIADQARFFSITASTNARQYKSVVSRLVKKRKEYKEGDEKPWYLRIPEEKPKYPFIHMERLYFSKDPTEDFMVDKREDLDIRSWLPNVVTKRLWSEALNKTIKIRLTSRVLRTITKEGGLDNYLTKEKSARIKELGIFGWKLRYDVLKAREKANKPLNYDLKKNPNGEDVKVFYSGTYKGEPIQLTVGRRKLASLLFPVVRNHTTEHLSFAKFGVEHAKASFGDILKECEGYDMDLSNVSFKPEVSQ
ncbi:hypothetical protein BRETT_002371 [Brettanomyces bruxellensis]|uniref:54S ribosomal protein L24, mitochondrial n=1 Tax=Dekkera bruxellensis TaxID=5007 RepID=A0A871R8K2_DEKBR|nr:uncharacterized protein BRETT_002371 [Brettanomyces bruxellensis]QOU22199.1 hypothetical protein BRETT_002371 [Brettanomyces bruxellensis]